MTTPPRVLLIQSTAVDAPVIEVHDDNPADPDALRAALRWAFMNPDAVLRLKQVMEEDAA